MQEFSVSDDVDQLTVPTKLPLEILCCSTWEEGLDLGRGWAVIFGM